MLKKETRRVYRVFSPFLRIFHWTVVVSCIVLFATGLYIASPFSVFSLEPATSGKYMNLIRDIHLIAAFIFTSSLILRIYGFIINKGDRLFPRVWEGHFYREVIDVAKHYMFLSYHHRPYLRNPLARAAYAGFYFLAAFEIATGFAIYFMQGSALFENINLLTSGIYMSRVLHHYIAWIIILFGLGHIYLVFREDFMDGEGELSSMVSGYKIYRHRPEDVDELGKEAHTKEYWKNLAEIQKAEKAERGY